MCVERRRDNLDWLGLGFEQQFDGGSFFDRKPLGIGQKVYLTCEPVRTRKVEFSKIIFIRLQFSGRL